MSTVSRQFYLFEQGNIEVLKSLSYEVHGAANFEDVNERLDALDIVRHHFDIQRSPFSLKNIKAYKQLKKIMKSESFDVVHCHSPMGGVLARLAAKSVGLKTVIYTAHGFHFYKGAPIINWLLYYPVEKWLSRYTDILITINKEDFDRAKSFKTCRVEYVPGIGIDVSKFNLNDEFKRRKRKALNISEDAIVILSVGELNKNKNHEVVIKAISKTLNKNIEYIVCGQGELQNYLEKMVIELGLRTKVKLLGFRNDISEIYSAVDLFVFLSYREGLSVSLMEAMASGLPVIASRIRGNTDLIQDGSGGFLHEPRDYLGIAKSVDELYENERLRTKMGFLNKEKVKKYDKQVVKKRIRELYDALQ
ncbi:glycosyltransferase family 4 protein [Senegalia massiliensis]|uniref:glycosyltransferase family 4 protein n=1 Tax=Senegalia massiliensis TaxID=1720316 RepID=UPI001A9294A8|nr:glycosyltransferase family 4 protein [Senegalia massiliensis]